MALKFTDEEIIQRYESFVSRFLEEETNVIRTEMLPRFWTVSVPQKDFHVTIECKNIGIWHGIEQWCAVVKEPNGEESNYLLFEDEIGEWAAEQRRLKGIE